MVSFLNCLPIRDLIYYDLVCNEELGEEAVYMCESYFRPTFTVPGYVDRNGANIDTDKEEYIQNFLDSWDSSDADASINFNVKLDLDMFFNRIGDECLNYPVFEKVAKNANIEFYTVRLDQ